MNFQGQKQEITPINNNLNLGNSGQNTQFNSQVQANKNDGRKFKKSQKNAQSKIDCSQNQQIEKGGVICNAVNLETDNTKRKNRAKDSFLPPIKTKEPKNY